MNGQAVRTIAQDVGAEMIARTQKIYLPAVMPVVSGETISNAAKAIASDLLKYLKRNTYRWLVLRMNAQIAGMSMKIMLT